MKYMNIFYYIKLIQLLLNKNPEKEAGNILIRKNMTLSSAESCTGGLVSSLLTDISGSSSYIKSNFVTYANEAKMKYLNVSENTLKNYGAVSEQTASEMVAGLLKETNTDYAIATTGIAGPSGGTEEKPVGLVYIAIASKDRMTVHKYLANKNYPRVLIKYLFAKKAVKLLAEFLREENQ